MLISLHMQESTTLRIRATIQASSELARLVAERDSISEHKLRKWRGRGDVRDLSHTRHRLKTTPQ
jgi:hypothetical protein